MALVDPKRIEYYEFGQKGALAATFGQVDGMCFGPLLGWRLYGGRLFICDFEGKTLDEELHLIHFRDDEVKVSRSNGELALFRRN